MYSKGIHHRTVNHPILQDGRSLVLDIISRKWVCKNCHSYCYDSFNFVEKFKQTSNLTDLMILDKMKDLSVTAVHVAKELNVSDTYVHETFMRYVDLPRLPLCRVLCMDEVYLRFDKEDLYPVILMNWETGDIIDILPNRYRKTIYDYLTKIPVSERDQVEYLVSDMFDTYRLLAGPGCMFRNATSVIDTFHHTQPLIFRINDYICKVKKEYQKRDRCILKEENYQNNRNHKTRKDSREVYLLKHYDYFLLKNHDEISYDSYWKRSKGTSYRVDPAELEKEFMGLDKNFPVIREQKEKYIHFTHDHINDTEGAARELDELISFYRSSELYIFRGFAEVLNTHKEGIIASFNFLKAERASSNDEVLHRISTGPLESYNNHPKDLKRQSNGVKNFQYTRNRLLWANRKNPAIKAVPYTRSEVHTEGKKRGSYRKRNHS